MYVKSASVGLQADAMLAAAARWGEGLEGKEQIPFPVCKRKYQPTRTLKEEHQEGSEEGQGDPTKLKMMFACHLHNDTREKRIKCHGPRPGWESFEQWHGAMETQGKRSKASGSTGASKRTKLEGRKTEEGPSHK
eukprot:CAMPEP_0118950428 /NCGR_PEP_ID=MMETSP1169-20130426/51346_1 /TAXON_ID=36882 /ORGANISM="Pyramimonas obovata, Strain CCMP722" /LENGTH=134 /DNA_ID=CAMNT_0006897259 /DNA_START=151 /DNA_END=555 /DNA_ORIENTATION=-